MDSSKFQTFKQHSKRRSPKFFPEHLAPTSADWGPGNKQAAWTFSDGGNAVGSCIRCENPPCMEFGSDELDVPGFPDFPADLSRDVCPSKAITWPNDAEAPQINPDLCMSCGLCLSRCPVNAIFFNGDLRAEINDAPNNYFKSESETGLLPFDNVDLENFKTAPTAGCYLSESDGTMSLLMSRLRGIEGSQPAQFPNHLARNLLLAVGNRCAMRRLGDTNIRMDLVLSTSHSMRGIGEVEFGLDVLDAPRNILDNAAVLIARYSVEKDALIPLIVSLSLPNRRSEYWQVIRDISRVLEMDVQSITFGVLMLLVWNRKQVDFSGESSFYADSETPSVHLRVETLLERALNLSEGHEGLMQSQK